MTERTNALQTQPALRNDFVAEMHRFLPAATVRATIENPAYWGFLIETIKEQTTLALRALN